MKSPKVVLSLTSLFFLSFLSFLSFLFSCDDNEEVPEAIKNSTRANSYEAYNGTEFYRLTKLTVDSSVVASGLEDASFSQPILMDGNIYILGSGGNIVRYTETKADWIFKALDSTRPSSNLEVIEGKSYYLDNRGNLHIISENGEESNSLELIPGESLGTAYISHFGKDLLISTSDGRLMVVGSEGGIKSQREFPMGIAEGHASKGETIAVALTHNDFTKSDTLLLLDHKLNEIKAIGLENVRIVRNPIIEDDRIYVAGTRDLKNNRFGIVKAFTSDGEPLWEKEMMNMPRAISIAADTTLYLASYSFGLGSSLNSLTAFDANGEIMWNKSYKMDILSPVFITKESLYVYAADHKSTGLYRLSRNTGGNTGVVSLSEHGDYHFEPAIAPDGTIYLARTDSLGYAFVE